MFKWSHEHSIEVDAPLQTAWDFYVNPSNWPKWEDRFDSCALEGQFKTGAKVKAKIKNMSAHLLILVTDVKPYHECRCLVKVPFSTQESLCTFQEISPGKTRMVLKIYVISLLAPFMKSTFLKNVEKSNAKCIQAFAEFTGKLS